MPLYIQNEEEMRAAGNDAPLPAGTPSTGSISNSNVVECGNKVLQMIEQHKREIQARMATREQSFRSMLERKAAAGAIGQSSFDSDRNPRKSFGNDRSHRKSFGNNDRYPRGSLKKDRSQRMGFEIEPNPSTSSNASSRSPPANTSSTSTGGGAGIGVKESFVQAYLNAVRHEHGSTTHDYYDEYSEESRQTLENMESEEYFDPPQFNPEMNDYDDDEDEPSPTQQSFKYSAAGSRKYSANPTQPSLTASANSSMQTNSFDGYEDRRASTSTPSRNTAAPTRKSTSPRRVASPSRKYGDECIFDPEEDPDPDVESSVDESVDDNDVHQTNRVNNNRVKFSSKVLYQNQNQSESGSTGAIPATSSPANSFQNEQNDNNADQEDEGQADHSEQNAEPTPAPAITITKPSINTPSTNRSRTNMINAVSGTGTGDMSWRGNRDSGGVQDYSSPSSSSLDEEQEPITRTSWSSRFHNTVTYLRETVDGWFSEESGFWKLGVILAIVLLVMGMVMMSLQYIWNLTGPSAATKVEPELYKYYGPVM